MFWDWDLYYSGSFCVLFYKVPGDACSLAHVYAVKSAFPKLLAPDVARLIARQGWAKFEFI